MIRLSSQDLEACSRAVQALYSAPSLEEFPNDVLKMLLTLIPPEHVTKNDDTARPRKLTVRAFPERPEIQPLLPPLAAHFHTHPLIGQLHSAEPAAISDVTSFRQFRETALFREYYRLINVTEQMIFSAESGQGDQLLIALNRNQRHFSARDRAVAAFLAPHIAQAHHNLRINSRMAADFDQITQLLGSIDRAVISAGQDGRISCMSVLAREWLLELFPEFNKSSPRLPSALRRRMGLSKTNNFSAGTSYREFELPLSPQQQLTVRFVSKPDGAFVIVLERERAAIGPFVEESLGLTRREREILFWISEAKTDREMAAIFGISHRTVHKHVEHLFAKLEVNNRAAAQRLGCDLRRL